MRSLRRIVVPCALVALIAAGCTQTVRVDTPPAGAQSLGAEQPSLSRDGRFVAFIGGFTKLTPVGERRVGGVFVHDTATNRFVLTSVASDGARANADSFTPLISANGRFVAFWSEASNLAPNDNNDDGDVFVHDMKTRQTKLLTRGADGTATGGASSDFGVSGISDDGSKVLIVANSLELPGGNGFPQLYLADVPTGTLTLLSDLSQCPLPHAGVDGATMTHDATKVAYGVSCYGPEGGVQHLMTRLVETDLVAHTTTVAFTKDSVDNTIDYYVTEPSAFTTDGNALSFVVRDEMAPHGETDVGYVRRNSVNTVFDPGDPVGTMVISPNGRYVLYSTPETDGYAPRDTNIVMVDTETGKRYWVAVTATGAPSPNGVSIHEVWSPDGFVIGYDSDAPNLIPSDNRQFGDVTHVYTRTIDDVLTISPR